MSEDALRVLGLGPDTDARTVEATYWKRAKELAAQRSTNPAAAEELEKLNAAYQTLSRDFVYGAPRPNWKQTPRRRRIKRYALAGVIGASMFGALVVGLSYQSQIADGAKQGYEQGEASWNDTIEWLQELSTTPTPQAPKPPKGE